MLHVWDCESGNCSQAVSAHRGNVISLGNCGLVNGKQSFYSAGSDGLVKLWNLGGGGGNSSSSGRSTQSQLVCASELFLGYHCKAVFSPLHNGIFASSVNNNFTQFWAGASTGTSAGTTTPPDSVVSQSIPVPMFKFQQQPSSVGSPTSAGGTGTGTGDIKPTSTNWSATDLPCVTDSNVSDGTDVKNSCTDVVSIACNMSNKHYVALSYKSGDIVCYE